MKFKNKENPRCYAVCGYSADLSLYLIGGDKGIRTPDLLHAKQALSQLSYTPIIVNGWPLI